MRKETNRLLDMIEEGLVRRGLFLRDLRFDDFGRVNVVCGKRDK